MRVLIVNDQLPGPTGGAEVYLERLVAGLTAAGDEVGLVAGEHVRHGLGKVLVLWDPAARRLVRERAAAFRPDVVHHHNVLRDLSASVLAMPPGVPRVLTVHDHRLLGRTTPRPPTPAHLLDKWVKQRIDPRVARRAVQATVAVSADLAAELRAAGFPRVRHVAVPVSEPALPPEPLAGCTDVVYAGRLMLDKGPLLLADAFDLVAAQVPQARLVYVGTGPDEAAVAAAAARLRDRHGADRVVLLGQQSTAEVSRALGRARVVVVPSQRPEGSPLVPVEAAMHGRPVVATDRPGLAAAVEALGGGLVVPETETALAAAVVRLFHDGALAGSLAAAGGPAARARHSVASVVAATREVYAELLA